MPPAFSMLPLFVLAPAAPPPEPWPAQTKARCPAEKALIAVPSAAELPLARAPMAE